MPGYLIPEYVLDTPGGWGKIPLGGNFSSEAGRELARIEGRERT
jgi:hypothetical protein